MEEKYYSRKDTLIGEIKYVASHIQAIKQTYKTIKNKFKNIKIVETKDTALAAKMLLEGEIPRDTVIICNKEIGLMYDLEHILEDVSDNKRI